MAKVQQWIERFRGQKPAGKAAVVLLILLAQCCICILPFQVISAANGAASAAGETDVRLAGEMYVVGTDIRPGLYRGEADAVGAETCSWARLENTGVVVGKGRGSEALAIRVAREDYALRTDCALQWIGDEE